MLNHLAKEDAEVDIPYSPTKGTCVPKTSCDETTFSVPSWLAKTDLPNKTLVTLFSWNTIKSVSLDSIFIILPNWSSRSLKFAKDKLNSFKAL